MLLVLDLNEILNELNQNIEDTEFIISYPNKKFSSPIKNKYVCTISIELNTSSALYERKYKLKLMSPLNLDGTNLYNKSQEISDFLLGLNCDGFSLVCNTNDIVFSESMRCLYIEIELLAQKVSQINGIVRCDNIVFNVCIIEENVICNSFDIKTYGASKPIDTIIGGYTYNLKIKVKKLYQDAILNASSMWLSYTLNNKSIQYRNYLLKSCTMCKDDNSYIVCEFDFYNRNID